ncbi:type III-A CRISPR-associated RAMP protein Csm5 [Tuanshanicoccus lijuaniae]|uniref:type III-A CRISPR-associated RAMP protein Csm5 n=1 Tax=Aerococcaceae bacterium zg-1292 TaxID=2774330 RepID=UPI001BD90708|nr:type III-A CRISPR-associated RAMP protein Csm5 [Aerococcaceae bacterium zg-A91]MBS4458501.1 type III-A CRISPR-associated RAMP protein Csm5 [Aerococcaceae bacterium zg-BR33]
MEKIRKEYLMRIMTFAPVHIGSGIELKKNEFIEEKDAYYFPDMGRVYGEVIKKGPNVVKQFESMMMKKQPNQKAFTLSRILKELNIQTTELGGYRIPLVKHKDPHGKIGNPSNISTFIRNGLGQPYIPGSSVKGALRTILVNQFFHADNLGKSQNGLPIISWGAKRNEAFDDIFHEIQISDSEPFSEKSLILTQKIDYAVHMNKLNGINTYRESIKPGTGIFIRIICTSQRAIDIMDKIHKYTEMHNIEYQKHFLQPLSAIYLQQKKLGNMLYLGGGTGFWTKTWIKRANLKDKQSMYTRNGRLNKTRMVEKGALKLTKAQPIKKFLNPGNKEGYYEMGLCYFDIKGVR